ncbi:hypothetical protein LB566_21560 [Mesorhizobium sp. CA13]|uniref:hypothetical protein n=1 Tax=unclassified Mesorhizobium TaxID=325217 RepID=UPI00112A0704|nr:MULTISPECIES: hypothetical protein [unclassified Mesorhizobium]MBZ9856400.1 hypothetical protein [Mesorhizobium sp. CA13]MBZ9922310.1 hypothetical protein [Mesorhizobium sp. BR1-1-7]MCA0011970.1 hypothetical protein [Mesorhizobium sp. B294B1A1]MCA0038224.1 hypothetical protein [Mesorhizobium sp. B292B1B]TPM44048.1 hypothetical protein FJ964_19190 [Mesorhizobium sp. B2-3-2]
MPAIQPQSAIASAILIFLWLLPCEWIVTKLRELKNPLHSSCEHPTMEGTLTALLASFQKHWDEWAPALGVSIAIAVCLVWTVYLPIVGLRHLMGW